MFRDRKIVFGDPTFSVPMLQQAMAINGWIAMAGPRNCEAPSPREYCSRHTPSTICRRLQRHAKPWPDALAAAMLHWTDSQIEDLFLQLQINAPQLDRVRRACRPELRDRLNRITAAHKIGNTVRVEEGVVLAQDGCLYIRRDSEQQHQLRLICNVQVRLEHIVTHYGAADAIYSGTIRFDGEDIPFAAPRNAFETRPMRWLEQHLQTLNKSVLHYESRWDRRILYIISQFHSPTLVPGIRTVGWDDERLHFAIPGYRIGLNGVEIVAEIDVPVPAARLRYSSGSLPMKLPKIGNEYEMGLFWAAS